MNYLLSINPIYLSIVAGLFSFCFTVMGSAIVFFFHRVKRFLMDIMLALSAGIMISSSFFSLLNPAIKIIEDNNYSVFMNIILGFITGCLLIYFGNILIKKIDSRANCSLSKFKRDIMLFSSITLHNIPEGLVIGVSYGSVLLVSDSIQALISAISLTIGIALQNFPEGSAISLPLRRDGFSRIHSFLIASLSGIVEPIAAVLGALLVIKIKLLLPFILTFTAGAMLFVVIMELIPECQKDSDNDVITLFILLGFLLMMFLEVLF